MNTHSKLLSYHQVLHIDFGLDWTSPKGKSELTRPSAKPSPVTRFTMPMCSCCRLSKAENSLPAGGQVLSGELSTTQHRLVASLRLSDARLHPRS